jgi:hypothetical protein
LVERRGDVCLVKRISVRGLHWHYEVVRLRVHPEQKAFGRIFPKRESYPKARDWGKTGFTFLSTDLVGAQRRMDVLESQAFLSKSKVMIADYGSSV